MPKHHGVTPLRGFEKHCRHAHRHTQGDRFGRMFPELPPLYVSPSVLNDMGAPNGPMDGGSGSDQTQTVPVGHVFFGQFIDHDITLDVTSSLSSVVSPDDEITNVRTPALDLDCVYGDGPEPHPFLYSQQAPFSGAKLLTGADMSNASSLQQEDLARSSNGRAIIGDPRNDENRVLSQMQLGMIRFHNEMANKINHEEGLEDGELFEHAREATKWHYQWAVVNDFLVAMCGRPVVDDILGHGRKHYCLEGEPYIPVEFSVATYRFGHSMVPQKIQVQKNAPSYELFGNKYGLGFSALSDSAGVVDWHELFETSANRQVQQAEKLNTKLAHDLLDLPFISHGEKSLATRNLLRGQAFMLPSGEAVAEACGRPESEVESIQNYVDSIMPGKLTTGIPLWFYILVEAELIGRETIAGQSDPGEGLGPVGARIVAEVIIGQLELDSGSYLGANRAWSPMTDAATIGEILTWKFVP